MYRSEKRTWDFPSLSDDEEGMSLAKRPRVSEPIYVSSDEEDDDDCEIIGVGIVDLRDNKPTSQPQNHSEPTSTFASVQPTWPRTFGRPVTADNKFPGFTSALHAFKTNPVDLIDHPNSTPFLDQLYQPPSSSTWPNRPIEQRPIVNPGLPADSKHPIVVDLEDDTPSDELSQVDGGSVSHYFSKPASSVSDPNLNDQKPPIHPLDKPWSPRPEHDNYYGSVKKTEPYNGTYTSVPQAIQRTAYPAGLHMYNNPIFNHSNVSAPSRTAPPEPWQVLEANARRKLEEESRIRRRALQAELARMPLASQPPSVKTKMLPHQLQALAWMKSKEKPELPKVNSQDMVQFWRWSNSNRYLNIISQRFSTLQRPPILYSGGVLADDMGLGKTLQMISLVTSDPGTGPTLIVSPLSVMSNWEQQFKQHVHSSHALRILVFHSSKCSKFGVDDLKKFDIIITTYNKLAMELTPRKILTGITWRRVILDEGHMIRNASTKSAKAACLLQATSKWVVTGTPIINRNDDLYSLALFVGVKNGLEAKIVFRRMMNNTKQCQAFVADLCLRRTKNMEFVNLKLPPKTENVEYIDFNETERENYNVLLQDAQEAARRFFGDGQARDKNALWSTVLERLLRLRQYCNHWTLSAKKAISDADRDYLNETELKEEHMKSPGLYLNSLVRKRELCLICWDSMTPDNEPVLSPCMHGFCKPCINQTFPDGHIVCPKCSNEFDETELVEAKFTKEELKSETDVTSDDINKQSSKTIALYKLIRNTLKDPESKVVIFSQWTSFLDIVQRELAVLGMDNVRIDGTMKGDERDASINAIQNDPGTRIMLASLRAAGVGITLTAANTVILADTWWAPAIEEQAVDRIHRLGQTRPTTVYRLVIKQTVEEGVIGIQDEKRKLFGEAFQEKFKVLQASGAQDMVRRLLSN
ncbi:hypothetical protein BROUX41_006608 [Berkeleyomyces rouxiae]|uniref:uncharacterized protein n=1 Tax=Berkeleyomyces rouxiae TaxID=2035830 RepID=UPI003B7E9EE5